MEFQAIMGKNKIDPITVGFAVDENYVRHLSVTMLSILHNKKADVKIQFVVIGDGLSEESKSALKQLIKNNNASLFFPNIEYNFFDKLKHPPILPHVSRATYGRLFLTDIFEGDKLLYLDCDILVRGDISELWDIDIAEYYAGAVLDPAQEDSSRRLGMPPEVPYFNSGVLSLNLKKCRQDNIMKEALKFMAENSDKIIFPDQDGLNVAMCNNWFSLHPRWNVQSYMFNIFYDGKLKKKFRSDIVAAVKNPAIVHFTSEDKPWHYRCENPYVEEYYKYLAQTPWKGNAPEGRSFRGMIRKNRRLLKRRFKSAILGFEF
jgi:lipopolysaccharide biosynthesis glycosyltransferase